jgi:undecaprenyl-diphosphatase
MTPSNLQIAILGLVQGLAEPLPVSSSAHVIAAEKLMGIDPSSPQMTFMLIMLHTGSLGAVIVYFWAAWRRSFFSDAAALRDVIVHVALATAVTLALGLALKVGIERLFLHGGDVEGLFSNLPLIAAALAVGGILILAAGLMGSADKTDAKETAGSSIWIGAIQGLVLPFRGWSRSGATISLGMLLGIGKRRAEEFSFALVVVLTPFAIAVESYRLFRTREAGAVSIHPGSLVVPGLLGMACSFVGGLAALRWLSRWLEAGRWSYFGVYCLLASVGIIAMFRAGY